MSGAQPIIQRPPNMRIDKVREGDLRNYMGISKENFELFKVGCITRPRIEASTVLAGCRRGIRCSQTALCRKVSTKARRMGPFS